MFLRLAVILIILVNSCWMQRCINTNTYCITRYELQFDFASAFGSNCTALFGSCLCLKGKDLVFVNMPPYIYEDKKTGHVLGLLDGESR